MIHAQAVSCSWSVVRVKTLTSYLSNTTTVLITNDACTSYLLFLIVIRVKTHTSYLSNITTVLVSYDACTSYLISLISHKTHTSYLSNITFVLVSHKACANFLDNVTSVFVRKQWPCFTCILLFFPSFLHCYVWIWLQENCCSRP